MNRLPRAKKSYGQHFLVDRSVLKKMIDAADLQPGETVLEVGPGTGVLTEALLNAGAKVVAIEADHDLIPDLQKKFGDRITLIEGDILSAFYPLPSPSYKLVANIPYNITSALLEKFFTTNPRPSRMILMVQREVADRIVAEPPEMGLLSVVCQIYADVKKVVRVPRGAFRPAPKVDSAVVRLDLREKPLVHDPETVIAVAKAGFSSPRKQLHSNLDHAGLGFSEKIKKNLIDLSLSPRARAETLRAEDWIGLTQRLFSPR